MARPPIRAPTLRVYVRRGTRRGRAWPSWPRSTQGRVLLCLSASSGFGPPAWGRRPGQVNQPTNCAAGCCCWWMDRTRARQTTRGTGNGMQQRSSSSFLSCKERASWHLVFALDASVLLFWYTYDTRSSQVRPEKDATMGCAPWKLVHIWASF